MAILLSLTDDQAPALPSSFDPHGARHCRLVPCLAAAAVAGTITADPRARRVKMLHGDEVPEPVPSGDVGIDSSASCDTTASASPPAQDVGGLQDKRAFVLEDTSSDFTQEGQVEGNRPQQTSPYFSQMTQALSCYPIISEITRSIDLNTLHDLSMTCHRVRASLLLYRSQLVKQTLCCEYEYLRVANTAPHCRRPAAEVAIMKSNGTASYDQSDYAELPSRRCARDLVGPCRNCALVMCRNCIGKPPSPRVLKERHRRLCPTCLSVPISHHTLAPRGLLEHRATAPATPREPCCCPDRVWLCQPCGQHGRNMDRNYKQVWSWRSRYSTHLGGIGTGIGNGAEGVKCGRSINCLAAREVEVEVDGEGENVAASVEDASATPTEPMDVSDTAADGSKKMGYLRHEIEGIGGRFKKKRTTRFRVGDVVDEYDDEGESTNLLAREARGEKRSWCGWCDRVVPGPNDMDDLDAHWMDVYGRT